MSEGFDNLEENIDEEVADMAEASAESEDENVAQEETAEQPDDTEDWIGSIADAYDADADEYSEEDAKSYAEYITDSVDDVDEFMGIRESEGFSYVLDGSPDDSPLPATDIVEEHPRTDFLEHPELLRDEEHDPYLMVHLADIHLAPKANRVSKVDPVTGRSIHDLDMSAALTRAVDDVLEQRPLPSACVIAGDIFDTWASDHDSIIEAAAEIKRLRLAGIEIASIAGNHDTPSQKRKTPAYVLLQHEFSDIAEDGGITLAYDDIEHVKIGNVEYVLAPHNALENGFDTEDFDPQFPEADKKVLVVHGVAAGDAALRNMNELTERGVAKWLLDMDWDYIAFGHFHKPGWIPGYKGKAAYCGSLENTVISGPDVCMTRGPVYVDLTKSGEDMVLMHPQRIRKIVSLPTLDLKGMDIDPGELDKMIADLIADADIDDAIVKHYVINVPSALAKSMVRQSFEAVNPNVLFLETKVERQPEMVQAVKFNEDTGELEDEFDPDTGEPVMVNAADTVRNFLPLEQELVMCLDQLIAEGNIRESRREKVLGIVTQVLGESKKD